MLTFDKDFLKEKPKGLQVVVFRFPKVPTSEILTLIEGFLETLEQAPPKNKVLKFSKRGIK